MMGMAGMGGVAVARAVAEVKAAAGGIMADGSSKVYEYKAQCL